METSPKIIQPNAITTAKYDYSVTEKRIIYHIIRSVQDKMVKGMNETLFGDLVLTIPIKELVNHENYKRVQNGLVSLRKKSFLMITDIDPTGKGEHGWLDVGFINYSEYNVKSGLVEFEVTRKLMPYLLELAKGFTSYSLMVALSLKSEYSQRFYEFCSRFKDTGVWNISVKDLKEMLNLSDKYPFFASFKQKVLDVAQKELKVLHNKGECDLWFSYTEHKTGKKVTDLRFKIVSEKNIKALISKPSEMQFISNELRKIYPNEREQEFIKSALNQLFNKSALSKFAKRLEELDEEVVGGTKKSSDLPPLVRYILKADYGIS
jgi:plasmid replication initiation protein